MKRIYLVMAAILVSLFAFGCGGGSGQVADPNTPAGGNGDSRNPSRSVQVPSAVVGSDTSKVIPGRLEISTAVSDAELDSVLARYGYTVIERNGNKASISIPTGIDAALAASELQKEYAVSMASPTHLITTSEARYDNPMIPYTPQDAQKSSSFLALNPMYADVFFSFGLDQTDAPAILPFNGQRTGVDANGFPGAWDAAFSAEVSPNPVSIAIIDAGWFDYSIVNRNDLDETNQLDASNSGSVDGSGTFTSGLTAATWDTADLGNNFLQPFRSTGDRLLGIMAATPNSFDPRAFDFDGSTTVSEDEIWNEGGTGVCPDASYMLIKTGSESGGAWTFSEAEIAASIDHAVSAGANVILLGMFGDGAVGGTLSTALQNAADNDVLCIAPAGDVISSFNGTGFDSAPVDISVNPVSPASDPNCVSVCATGPNRIPGVLNDLDFGNGNIVPNNGTGWYPGWNAPFDDRYFAIPAGWANTGGDIAACSDSIGFGPHPFLLNGDGTAVSPGHSYTNSTARFRSENAAAYVAGAAGLIFKALAAANGGTPPTDDEVRQAMFDNVSTYVTGLNVASGLLSASEAVNAIAGGGVSGPAMGLSVPAGQLVPATLLTTFQLAPAVTGGTGPFDLSIDWGDGNAPTVVNNWANNDPVALSGGWDTLGRKTVLITVTEQGGDMRSANRTVEIPVYNAITTNLTVMGPIDPQDPGQGEKLFTPAQPIQDAVTYTFSANVANVFNGSVNGTPNNPQFGWDFDGDNVIDKPGTTVEHAFISTGNFNIKFIVTQDVLPDFEVTRTVLVN